MPRLPSIIHGVLDVIRLKWSVDVLLTLGDGPLRYTDLQHAITVSSGQTVYNRPLTLSLRHLQRTGLIEQARSGEDASAYQLTALGLELREYLEQLGGWCDLHRSDLGL